MEQDSSISNFLDGEKIRLGIGGFYPSRIARTKLINSITVFIYLITFGQMSSVANFLLSSNDLSAISETLLFSMTQVAFVNKILNFHMKTTEVAKLDQMLFQRMFARVTPNELSILKKSFKKTQRVVNVFLVLCAVAVFLYGLFPAIDRNESGGKSYPFPGKYPFDPDNYYLIVYAAEMASIGVSAWFNGGLDCLFTKHATIAGTLCTILCEKIKRLMDHTNENKELTVENRIKSCIIYHNGIIEYVSMIENTLSYGIFVQFLCSAFVICLTGFQLALVVSFQSAKFGLLLIYFSCVMFQLILYCWFGHILIDKSDGITEACYSVSWDEMSVKERKMLIIIMERAKRPIALKAAGIFNINVPTLMTILRSSYSYFAVLQRIYGKRLEGQNNLTLDALH